MRTMHKWKPEINTYLIISILVSLKPIYVQHLQLENEYPLSGIQDHSNEITLIYIKLKSIVVAAMINSTHEGKD